MNQLIKKLEEYYKGSSFGAEVNEQENCLRIKQRILTGGGFLNLDILVVENPADYKKYSFFCYGLGTMKNVTEREVSRLKTFIENQGEIRLCMDERRQVYLSFEKEFYDITPYDLGMETMGEALKCVSLFGLFIKRNYQILKYVLKKIK